MVTWPTMHTINFILLHAYSFSVPIIYWKIELNFVLLSMTDACTEKNGMKFEFPKKIYQLYHFLDET